MHIGPILKARSIVKSFGRSRVLDGLDISLNPGTVTLLRGDNGSGKTTLLSILSLTLAADSGLIEMPALKQSRDEKYIRSNLGFVAHSSQLYGKLTVKENLQYFGELQGIQFLSDVIDDSVMLMGIEDRLNVRVDTLSHGLRKRASIVRSILHDPDVLLLDEPDSGLDSKSISMLELLIEDLTKVGKALLITSHGNTLRFGKDPVFAFLHEGKLTK